MNKYLKKIFRYFVSCIKFLSVIVLLLTIGEVSSIYYEYRKYLREGTSRIMFYHVPYLGHRLRPYYAADYENGLVTINPLGFRGKAFSIKKLRNTCRIICIGESTTFGLGSSDDVHSYPAILETKLNESYKDRGISFEVINAGIPSYTSAQCLILTALELTSFKPDILIIYTGWNEMGSAICKDWNLDYRYGFRFTDFKEQRKNFYEFLGIQQSFLLKRLNKTAGKLRRFFRIPEPKGVLPKFERADPFNKNALSVWENNVRNIIALAKANNIRVVLVTWPQLYNNSTLRSYSAKKFKNSFGKELLTMQADFNKKWMESYRLYQERLCLIAVDTSIHLCDVASAFLKEDNLSLFWDEIHLTDAGNLLFADLLGEYIKENILGKEKNSSK